MGPLYGVDDVLDGQKAEVVLNFHAYGDNGDAQLEVGLHKGLPSGSLALICTCNI